MKNENAVVQFTTAESAFQHTASRYMKNGSCDLDTFVKGYLVMKEQGDVAAVRFICASKGMNPRASARVLGLTKQEVAKQARVEQMRKTLAMRHGK